MRRGGRGGQAKARGTYFWWAAFPQSSPCCPKLKRHTLHHLSHYLPMYVSLPGRYFATRCSHQNHPHPPFSLSPSSVLFSPSITSSFPSCLLF